MDRGQVRAVVVAEILKLSKTRQKDVHDQANLELELGIDSLNKVELASNLLDRFHLEDTPLEEVVDVGTVGDVVDFVMEVMEKARK